MSQSDREGFLSRWSRRKRAAVSTPPPAPETPAEAPPAEALEEFDPASLPPIESLTAESDIAAFLRPQVPAALRTAALRRAWTLDPAIRDYVGPADYAWDFNAEQGMAGFSLELGGDVKRLLAQAIGLVEEAETPPAAPEAPAAAGPAPETPVDVLAETPGDAPIAPVAAAPPEPPPRLAAMPEPGPPPPQPRRHGGARPV
jgi:hypothetical protein